MSANNYHPTIGIECHVQLKTASKLFSAASNDARTAPANTLVNHIDFGLPGALPVLNHQALVLATRAALALNTKPQLFSTFDRKHYFYPDLPMGYQITQYDQPIIVGGEVNYILAGKRKRVRIVRAHLEADAGKSTHPDGQDYSLVDLNRSGTPLLEIVSEPDMHSAAEARAYAKELYLLMRYANVTEGDLFHGNMRFDVNVSISSDAKLGTRSETKNLNSFRAVEKAVEYEIKRQTELLKRGEKIVQETRGWNEAKQKTIPQRSKENADDYRYMPDPDLPPLSLSASLIEEVMQSMPETPAQWRHQLERIGLNEAQIETLIEANIDLTSANYLKLIADFHENKADTKQLANWLVNIDVPLTKANEELATKDRPALYKAVAELVKQGQLSSTNAKDLITRCLNLSELPQDLTSYAKSERLLQQSDTKIIEDIVHQIIKENPSAVDDVLRGEAKAIGFLIGQIMQKTKGQANPSLARELLTRQLNNIDKNSS